MEVFMKNKKCMYALMILGITAFFTACTNFAEPKKSKSEPTPEIVRGSYWGRFKIGTTQHNGCLVIKETSLELHSNMMGKVYPLLKCIDNKDGTWTISCYLEGEDTSEPTTHTIVTVNTAVTPHTCKPDVIPMRGVAGGGFTDHIKGAPYNNEFTK